MWAVLTNELLNLAGSFGRGRIELTVGNVVILIVYLVVIFAVLRSLGR